MLSGENEGIMVKHSPFPTFGPRTVANGAIRGKTQPFMIGIFRSAKIGCMTGETICRDARKPSIGVAAGAGG